MTEAMAALIATACLAVMLVIIWQPHWLLLLGLMGILGAPGLIALRRCKECDAPATAPDFCQRCGMLV